MKKSQRLAEASVAVGSFQSMSTYREGIELSRSRLFVFKSVWEEFVASEWQCRRL